MREAKECLKGGEEIRDGELNSTASDASEFFVAVGRTRKMHGMRQARKFRYPGDWMNSVNKKCAPGHCAPCTEKSNDVSFSILFSLPVWANVESRVFRRNDIRCRNVCEIAFIRTDIKYSGYFKIQ